MPESGNYFAYLGLTPGVYTERQLADRLIDLREGSPDADRLIDAARAFCVLRDPVRQHRYRMRFSPGNAAADAGPAQPSTEPARGGPGRPDAASEEAFEAAATAMLEGATGLLRYSNRRRLLDLAARLGIAPFEANLLIERARFRATAGALWPTDAATSDGSAANAASAAGDPAAPVAQPPRLFKPGQSRRLTHWLIAIALALIADAIALALLNG